MVLRRYKPLKRTSIKQTPWDKPKKEQEKKKAKAGLSKSKLRDKLDSVFSKYIRLKYSDDRGNCRCISCGKVFYSEWALYVKTIYVHTIQRRQLPTAMCSLQYLQSR